MSTDRVSTQRTAGLVAILVTVPFACSDAPDPVTAETGEISVRDSAGVEIVEIPGAALDTLPEWRIEPEPFLTIGEEFGEEPYMFSRIVGAFRMPDGRTVIADQSARELRFFDADGTFIAKAGRDGEGPGEFGAISFIAPTPDGSVFVLDQRLVRTSRFDAGGRFLGSERWVVEGCTVNVDPERRPFCGVLAIGPDGAPIVSLDFRFGGRIDPEIRIGDPDWTVVGTLRGDEFQRIDSVSRATPVSGMVEWEGGDISFRSELPFSPRGIIATGAGRVVSARGDVLGFEVRDLSGRLLRVTRVVVPAVPVTDEEIARFVAAQRTENPNRVIAEAVLDRLEVPDSVPQIDELKVDDVGRVWARQYNYGFGDAGVSRWWVFDANGMPLATIEAPWRPGTTGVPTVTEPYVLQIGEDFVLQVERDELDIERIAMYRIQRGDE